MDGAEHLKLDDLDLDDQAITVIRERADALIESNARQAQEALAQVGAVCSKIYKHHADSANFTCDGLRVFFRCHVVNDSNTQKLVRSKVLSIFKPSFRRVIASSAQESSVGIFGGSEGVINRLTKRKKVDQALRGTILPNKKNKGKGKGSNTK